MRLLIISLISIILHACSGHQPDARLMKASDLASSTKTAKEAISALDAIDRASLSDADRHFHDLLSIKAADKAYREHTSDSLILDVIDYYSSNDELGLYPEALYYGGRVYSDLGDYPTALEYYHDALELTPIEKNITLRGNILSQTGILLNELNLYDQAIPLLKEILSIDSIENDAFNLTYDNALIGVSYLYSGKTDLAKNHFEIAKVHASKLSKSDVANIKTYLAETELKSNNVKAALAIIRECVDSVSISYRNFALNNATEIYYKAGIFDSAYAYSYELIHSNDENNRRNGYSYILSPPLLQFSDPDSLPLYFKRYHKALEDYYNNNEPQLALLQVSRYNYRIHERERLVAENRSRLFAMWCCIIVVVCLIAAIAALYYKMKTKQNIIELNLALSKIKNLQKQIDETSNGDEGGPTEMLTNCDDLRAELNRLLDEIQAQGQKAEVSPAILKSDEYKTIQEHLMGTGESISDIDPIWNLLFDLVSRTSPNFWPKINQLFGATPKPHERQTIALIRCGITPSQMGILLGKTKGTISSRRESLCIKIFGAKTNIRAIDNAIRLL